MVEIHFLGPIAKKPLQADIKNFDELKKLLSSDDELKKWLDNSAVAVNDVIIKDKDIKFNDGDIITLLPPVYGG